MLHSVRLLSVPIGADTDMDNLPVRWIFIGCVVLVHVLSTVCGTGSSTVVVVTLLYRDSVG